MWDTKRTNEKGDINIKDPTKLHETGINLNTAVSLCKGIVAKLADFYTIILHKKYNPTLTKEILDLQQSFL